MDISKDAIQKKVSDVVLTNLPLSSVFVVSFLSVITPHPIIDTSDNIKKSVEEQF